MFCEIKLNQCIDAIRCVCIYDICTVYGRVGGLQVWICMVIWYEVWSMNVRRWNITKDLFIILIPHHLIACCRRERSNSEIFPAKPVWYRAPNIEWCCRTYNALNSSTNLCEKENYAKWYYLCIVSWSIVVSLYCKCNNKIHGN